MALNQYIGARYVPLITGEWDATISYEPLSVVLYQGASYTSVCTVPTGIPPTNSAFWALTGNYNAQVEQYRQEVLNLKNEVDKITPLTNYVTPELYGAIGDGVSDDSDAFNNAVLSGLPVLVNKIYNIHNIVIKNDVTIFGTGTLKTSLNSDGSSKNIFSCTTTGVNINISGITFVGIGTGEYIDFWNPSNIKELSESVFLVSNINNFVLNDVTFTNILCYNSGVGTLYERQFNVKASEFGKINSVKNVEFNNVNIVNSTGEGIIFYDCDSVNIKGGLIKNNMSSVYSVLYGKYAHITGLTAYGTYGNTINVNSSNTTISDSYFIFNNENMKEFTIDVSNEFDNRSFPGFNHYTVENTTITGNTFIDSIVVYSASAITEDRPNNYNQQNNVKIINNSFWCHLRPAFDYRAIRNSGNTLFCGNTISGYTDLIENRWVIKLSPEQNVTANIIINNNVVKLDYINETLSSNIGFIVCTNTSFNITANNNIVDYVGFYRAVNVTGELEANNNIVNGHWFSIRNNCTGNISLTGNRFININDESLGETTPKNNFAHFINGSSDKVIIKDNNFKGFNLIWYNETAFEEIIIINNELEITSTTTNSGIRLLNCSATLINVVGNYLKTTAQMAITTGTVASIIYLINNMVISSQIVVEGANATLNYINNVATNLVSTGVGTVNKLTIN